MSLARFAERHSYWFTALTEVVVVFVYLVAGTVAHLLGLGSLGLYGLANLGLTVVAVGLLTAMRWWKPVGFRAPDATRDLWYFLVPFLPILVNLTAGLEIAGLGSLTAILAITLTVGFVEESFFRGLMLNALKARGLWQAAIVSSLLFGLTHAMNGLAGGDALEVGAQICYAIALGLGFAALVLRKGIIWPLVLAHFLIDLTGFMRKPGAYSSPEWQVVIALGLTVVYTGYGLFLMLQRSGEPAPGGAGRPGLADT